MSSFLLFVSPAGNGNLHTPSLFVDYRHFDAANIKPRFEFGFGLSYTKFGYSSLSITIVDGGQDQDTQLEANWLAGKPNPHGVGVSTALWLHRPAYDISFTVQNMGNVAGTEVRRLSRSSKCVDACRQNKHRYPSCICTSPRRRESLHQSCADSRTWIYSRENRRRSVSRSPDMTCRYGTSRASRGCVPREHILYRSVRAVGISG